MVRPNITFLPVALRWYFNTPVGNEYHMLAQPSWSMEVKSQENINNEELKKWVEKQLEPDIKIGYIKVKSFNSTKVTIAFDTDKWISANFKYRPMVHYEPPRTLVWFWKKRLPDTVLTHTSWVNLAEHLEERFKVFLKRNHKEVFREKMRLFGRTKVNYDWFTFEAHIRSDRFFVRMKYSVMISLAVGIKKAKDVVFGR